MTRGIWRLTRKSCRDSQSPGSSGDVMKFYETLENKEGEHSGDEYLSYMWFDNDTDERMIIIIMMVMVVVVMMPSHGYYLNSWDSWGEDLLSLHRWRNGLGLRKRMDWTRWTVKHDVSSDGVMPPCFFVRRQLYCDTRVIGAIGQYWTKHFRQAWNP